ncbi:MAG: hypothetical protein ABFD79_17015 [Phycisphaerales bacterium]
MVEETTNMCYLQKNKVMAKLVCGLVILLSGIIIGSGATVLMVKHRVIWVSKVSKDANDIADKIARKYVLTDEQHKQVQQIMLKAFAEKKLFDQQQEKQRNDYAKVFIAEMNSVMTPEQFAKWNKDFMEMREKFKKRK